MLVGVISILGGVLGEFLMGDFRKLLDLKYPTRRYAGRMQISNAIRLYGARLFLAAGVVMVVIDVLR